jgi:hypothetical protein
VTTSNTGCDDTLGDTGCDGSFNDGGDGVHGADDFGLELGRDVEFDLLEEVFRGTETANDEDVLIDWLVRCLKKSLSDLPGAFGFELGWR